MKYISLLLGINVNGHKKILVKYLKVLYGKIEQVAGLLRLCIEQYHYSVLETKSSRKRYRKKPFQEISIACAICLSSNVTASFS